MQSYETLVESGRIGLDSVITTTRSLTERLLETNEMKLVSRGKFGRFGGKFVPETLMTCLEKLEAEFNFVLQDAEFQVIN